MRNLFHRAGLTFIRKDIKERWLHKQIHQSREAVADNLTRQAPKINTYQSNKQPAIVEEYKAKEVVGGEAVIKGKSED